MSDKFLIYRQRHKKAYPLPGGELFWALKGVDMWISPRRFDHIKGRSGSGKTTLMNILGALDDATEGQVIFDGVNISQMPEKERNLLRRRSIGFVFQSVALIPIMTARRMLNTLCAFRAIAAT